MCFGDFWDFRIFTSVHWSKPWGKYCATTLPGSYCPLLSNTSGSAEVPTNWIYCQKSKSPGPQNFFDETWVIQKNPIWKLRSGFLRESTAGWEGEIPPSLHRTNPSCQAAGSSHWKCTPVSISIFDSGSVQGLLHWPRPWHSSKRFWATPIPSVQEFFSCFCFQKQQNQELPQYSEIPMSQTLLSGTRVISQKPCWAQHQVLSMPGRIWEAQLPAHPGPWAHSRAQTNTSTLVMEVNTSCCKLGLLPTLIWSHNIETNYFRAAIIAPHREIAQHWN